MPSPAPLISILLVTYNHAAYIEEALQSIDMQDYEGAIDLIVCDDCSTDNTLNIIESFKFSKPQIRVRRLEGDANLGITRNYQRGFAATIGKYVAILEGDDRWTHPSRLTKLINILEEHHECAIACNNYFIYEEARQRFTIRTEASLHSFLYIDSCYLVQDNLPGNFSACVYRKAALDKIPAGLFELKSYDWIVNICVGMQGLLAYVQEPMSIYRLHSSSSWSALDQVQKLKSQMDMIESYNILTQGVFKEEFSTLSSDIRRQLLRLQATPEILKKIGIRRVARMVVHAMPPVIVNVIKLLVPPFIINRIKGS